jgi:hypothetical protein
MKNLIQITAFAICSLSALQAQATGGSFTCYTTSFKHGNNIFVQGILDGEANVLEAYRMQVGGDDNRMDLEAKRISLVGHFEIELQDALTPEEPTNIQIKAKRINGKSRAKFEIRNGEAMGKATGICDVRFKSGI